MNIIKILAKTYLRYDRGYGLCSIFLTIFKFTVYFGMLSIWLKDFFGVVIPPKIVLIFVPTVVILFYAIGHLDEKVGFWKYQNHYLSKDLNPFFKEMKETSIVANSGLSPKSSLLR